MFGIPVSTSAAISGYRLSVERITRFLFNYFLKDFFSFSWFDEYIIFLSWLNDNELKFPRCRIAHNLESFTDLPKQDQNALLKVQIKKYYKAHLNVKPFKMQYEEKSKCLQCLKIQNLLIVATGGSKEIL